MAKLTVNKVVDYKPITTIEIVETKEFELVLTEDEARYLWRLLGKHVIGRGDYRNISSKIWHALDNHFEVEGRPVYLPTVGVEKFIMLGDD